MVTLATGGTVAGVAGTASAVTYTLFGLEVSGGADSYKVLAQGQLPNAAATLYTVPAATVALVRRIVLANATGNTVAGVILYVNGTGAGNQISGTFSIPPNGSAVFEDRGWTIYDSLGNVFYKYTSIFDVTAAAATTPLVASAAGSAAIVARRDHAHQSPGGVASNNVTTVATSETQLIGATFPANFLNAGTTVRFKASIVGTNANVAESLIFNLKVGHASLTGTQVVTITVTTVANAATQAITVVGFLTFRTTGTAGQCGGELAVYGTNAASGLINVLNAISSNVAMNKAWDSTVTNVVELTATHGNTGNSITVECSILEVVEM